MIVIIDNGQSYSDHAIYFTDIGDADPERAAPLLLRLSAPEGNVLGTATSVEWRDPKAVMPVARLWRASNHHSEGEYQGHKLVGWKASTCPVYLSIQSEIDRLSDQRYVGPLYQELRDRPWEPSPEGPRCTCDAGKLYEICYEAREHR
jgi:hypothetical protein